MREFAFWCSYMVMLYVALSGVFNAIISLLAFGLAVLLFIVQQRFDSCETQQPESRAGHVCRTKMPKLDSERASTPPAMSHTKGL